MNKKFLYLIAARSGSKGVPNKNILNFDNIPALGLRIISILKSKFEGDIVCSTDSHEYAAIATSFGARAPFLRPESISSDLASSSAVISHALEYLKDAENKIYDFIILIEPSSPFTRAKDIDSGISLLMSPETDSVVSVKASHISSDYLVPLKSDGDFSEFVQRARSKKDIRRQAQQPEYTPNGCFYGSSVKNFLDNNSIYGGKLKAFEMESNYSIEIDNMLDAQFALFLWEKNFIEKSNWVS